MRRYETIFIVRPNAGEEKISGMIDRVTSIITSDGGTVIKIDEWGLKKLAYLIKKESQGYYVYIDFAGLPTSVTEIERILKIDDRCLKYMTVKLAESCDPEALVEESTVEESAVEESTAEESTGEDSGAEKSATSEPAAPKSATATETEAADGNDETKSEESA